MDDPFFLLSTEDSTDLQRRDIHGRLRERTSREAVARWWPRRRGPEGAEGADSSDEPDVGPEIRFVRNDLK